MAAESLKFSVNPADYSYSATYALRRRRMEKADHPVAQYLRMSTEKQEYSLDNQSAVIARYAAAHGLRIVRTYTDAGKSGVVLKHREALRMLLNDVVDPNVDFRAVLVYDVSRWGRFQDVDEAAHYEFICKSAGVPVIYCAETFANDGTMPSSIMKALKRVMAGEYSRELGVRVYEGQKRLSLKGFSNGGSAPYGYRRMLVSSEGIHRQLLFRGDRKSVMNDRVVLVLGPAREVEAVRRMYRMFITGRYGDADIARDMNRRGLSFVTGSKWTRNLVRRLLTNPKYAGFQVFGRISMKLNSNRIELPSSEWTLTPNAHEAIVSPSTFIQAQHVRFDSAFYRSNERLLDDLRFLLKRKGRLSLEIIEKDPHTVSAKTYWERFGSLCRAFELIGYEGTERLKKNTELRLRIVALHHELIERIQASCPGEVELEKHKHPGRDSLKVHGDIPVAVIVCCAVRRRKALSWYVNSRPEERNMIALVARMTECNTSIRDFYVVPRLKKARFQAGINNRWLNEGSPLTDLSRLCAVVEAVERPRTP